MRAKDFPLPSIEIRCDHCGRHGRYRKERFVQLVGEETELPAALVIISGDCPIDRATVDNMHGMCRPYYAQEWWRR